MRHWAAEMEKEGGGDECLVAEQEGRGGAGRGLIVKGHWSRGAGFRCSAFSLLAQSQPSAAPHQCLSDFTRNNRPAG